MTFYEKSIEFLNKLNCIKEDELYAMVGTLLAMHYAVCKDCENIILHKKPENQLASEMSEEEDDHV